MRSRSKHFHAAGFDSRVIPALELSNDQITAWEECCRTNAHLNSPFFSPHYTKAAAVAHGRVYVCVILHQGQVIGFLPFQFRNALHQRLGCAERVGGEMTDYFGLIAKPGLRIAACDLLRLAGLEHLYFTHLDQTQSIYGLKGEQPETGLLLKLEPGIDYWTQELRPANRKLASETERLERLVQREHGPLRFCLAESAWAQSLKDLIRCKGEQYVHSGRENMFVAPWRRRLVEILAEMRESSCTGMLSTLFAGDTWLASHFGLRSGVVLHYWFPVYNPDMRRYAPGRLLMKNIIQNAHAAGINLVDRGAGDTLAKRQLTNQEHLLYRGAWYRPGIRSTVFRLRMSLKWRLDRRLAAWAKSDPLASSSALKETGH
jgi:CelD/BcsL family acetyltransferase involved in cellulose biosynthesis